jgi:multidrug efflux pump subunit AcrA (membrane-fusion protein)
MSVAPMNGGGAAGLLSARKPVMLGLVTLLALVAGFGGWSVFSSISGAIVSSGQIEVAQNRQVVQHPDGGVVAEIAVKEAQLVKAGELLIRLDGAMLESELAIGAVAETQRTNSVTNRRHRCAISSAARAIGADRARAKRSKSIAGKGVGPIQQGLGVGA